MKKSNIIVIVLAILAPILTLVVGISIIRAWYTNTIQTGELDATSKNVAIKYQLNSGTENVTTYTINNLAFFDADSENEGEFLELLALKIDLKLTNNSDNDVKYTIKFESTKTILTKTDDEENEITTSIAYAACAFDSVTKDTTNHKTVNSYLVDSDETNTSATIDYTLDNATKYTAEKISKVNLGAKDDSSTDDEATVSLYVFGIQEIDSALSKDFLYTNANKTDVRSYQFTITIIAEPTGAATIEEN